MNKYVSYTASNSNLEYRQHFQAGLTLILPVDQSFGVKVPKCGITMHTSLSEQEVRRSERTQTSSPCLMNDEQAAVDQVCVCGGLQMIVQSFISSNSVSFRSCTQRLHKNRIRSCELPQPIDPAPQTWIALLWGSPASQTGFNHALSPNHGNLIYLKPLAVLLEPLYSLF